jgi:thiol-disulfide isomerase/thioredoxin
MRFDVPLLSAPLLSALLFLSTVAASPVAMAAGPAIGAIPPSAVGEDGDGRPVSLSAYRGKVVVVAFWTSSCAYCLKEVPTLENAQKQLASYGLQVVAVNVNDNSKDYGEMLRQMRKFSLVLAHDPGTLVAEAWDVRMFPNLWILDPEGRVVAHHEGYLEDALPGILAEIQRTVAAHQPQAAAN